jgi:hypothetical protein
MIEQLKILFAEKKYRIALWTILFAAFLIRGYTMIGPLSFDEIWTLENYMDNSVGKMLTDLATPNNHPLNSLFMKLWMYCFEYPHYLRFHSLIFGMLSVLLTGVLARGLFHSRAAALFSMLFISFDAAAISYSGQARGYAAQLFFLLLFACGIVYSGRLRRFLPWKYLPETAVIVGALGAVLAVPSAPIFLAAIVIAARVYRRKLPDASVLIAVGIAAALVFGYLGTNQTALREAQLKFGVRFNNFQEWFGFLLMILQDFCALAVAPFLLVLAATDRKRGLLLLVCAAVIVISPAFTSAGPSRVYLPLCVIVALGCGRGVNELITAALVYNNRKLVRLLIVATVFLAGFGCYQLYGDWCVPDYWKWFEAGQSLPPKCLVAYPATATYPLMWNNDKRQLARDQAERMIFNESEKRRLLCFGVAPGKINGMNAGGAEMELSTGVNGTPTVRSGFPAVEYDLYQADLPRPGEAFVAVSSATTAETVRQSGAVLRLNPHFPGGLIFGVAPQDSPEWWEYLRNSGARFYTFTVPGAAAAKP